MLLVTCRLFFLWQLYIFIEREENYFVHNESVY